MWWLCDSNFGCVDSNCLSKPSIFCHQVFPDASTQKLQSLWTSILHGYYLRPSPSSVPSFVEFCQGLWILQVNKWLSESHDILAKSMNFRTAAPKAQYNYRFQWNLVCSKGGYLTCSIPNHSWLLEATPKQSRNLFERVEQSKIIYPQRNYNFWWILWANLDVLICFMLKKTMQ